MPAAEVEVAEEVRDLSHVFSYVGDRCCCAVGYSGGGGGGGYGGSSYRIVHRSSY